MSAPFAIARSLQTKVCCDITESTQEKSLLPVECVGFVSMTAQIGGAIGQSMKRTRWFNKSLV